MQEIPFIGQAYKLPSLNAAAQRCVNMYLEGVPGETKGRVTLKKRSGLVAFVQLSSANRKIYATSNNRLFSVNADKLTEIQTNGTLIERGVIGTISGPLTMQDNGDQLVITDGQAGYVFELSSNTLSTIGSPNYPTRATHVTYQDRYIIVNNPASDTPGEFNISGLGDAQSWSALDFGNAEGSPDIVNALISTGRELWLFGPSSVEVWYNSGAADFPFQRISGGHFDIGCLAPYSVAKMDSNVFWLGADENGFGQIFTNNGYTPTKISTDAMQQEIVQYTNPSDAIGFCFQEGGHSFYVISFQAASKTWVFDTSTASWFEWMYTDYRYNIDTQYRGNSYAFFNGKNYVADPNSGHIYQLDPNTYTDNGNKIKVLRSSPHIWNGLDRVFFNSFQVDMETGVGLTIGQGSNPLGMLRHSDDGGHTWSNQIEAPLGKVGEYRARVKFNRLGQARDRVWEFSITDPVKVTILNAYIKANDGGGNG